LRLKWRQPGRHNDPCIDDDRATAQRLMVGMTWQIAVVAVHRIECPEFG
jgi:hypothetical protein